MLTAPISELKNKLSYYLRRVARGETVTVLDRGLPVAQISPLKAGAAELERLAASGLARLPVSSLPDDFWAAELPTTDASVVDALEEDRSDRV